MCPFQKYQYILIISYYLGINPVQVLKLICGMLFICFAALSCAKKCPFLPIYYLLPSFSDFSNSVIGKIPCLQLRFGSSSRIFVSICINYFDVTERQITFISFLGLPPLTSGSMYLSTPES